MSIDSAGWYGGGVVVVGFEGIAGCLTMESGRATERAGITGGSEVVV